MTVVWHVIGSNGYVAKRLLRRIPADETVYCYSRSGGENVIPLDLRMFTDEELSRVQQGDYVVLLAANSSPDACLHQYVETYAINVTGTQKFIRSCLDRGARVLFFSSDAVIGSTLEPQYENMEPTPVGNYAKMKREVEQSFIHEKNFKVFRLSYVFSKDDKFMKFLVQCTKEKKQADVFDALYRNVIYLEDVVDAVIALSKNFDQWENMIFHLSGPDLLSRKAMAELYQQEVAPECSFYTTMPPPVFFDARPDCIETASLYLERLLNRKARSIREAMTLEFGGKNK